jgi:hypothetical protein
MPATTGQINSIEEAETQRGKKYVRLTVNGESFFCWNPKLARGFKEGDYVRLTHTDDDYPKLRSIEKTSQAPDADTTSDVENGSEKLSKFTAREDRDASTSRRIYRSVALEQAVNFTAFRAAKEESAITAEHVTVVAAIFLKWLESNGKQE